MKTSGDNESQLKETNKNNNEQQGEVRKQKKRLTVNWDKNIHVKTSEFQYIKASFQEDINTVQCEDDNNNNVSEHFEEQRKLNKKNEFSKVKELLHQYDNDNIEEDDEDKLMDRELINENTKKNIQIGHMFH